MPEPRRTDEGKPGAAKVKESISPTGERFPLPAPEDYAAEFERLSRLAAGQREKGREIVVVVGVGFVGAVMAAVVADSVDKNGKPGKFVIGMQRPEPPQLLEDPAPEPRHLPGEGRGPGGGSP